MLTRLQLSDFRNYARADLEFSPGLNFIVGANGSGKTSLLEGIYFIGSGGRSFRGGRLSRLVRDGAEAATLFAEVERLGVVHRIGIRRAPSGIETLRLDGATPAALSDVAALLPVLALHPQSVDLLFGAAALRRRFLDWGMFHVEHSFLGEWKEANQALRHRNALLRSGKGSPRELRYWDQILAGSSDRIDQLRRAYLKRFSAQWLDTLQQLAPGLNGALSLQNGLRRGESFLDALDRTREEDLRRGFSHSGFHRSDLKITVEGVLARDRVSRGQAKILSYALVLAQLPLIRVAGKVCTLLVDDLGSELDEHHRQTMMSYLVAGTHQTIITAVDGAQPGFTALKDNGAAIRMFHVEHGRIQQVSDDP